MSRVERTIEIRARRGRLVEFAAAQWESRDRTEAVAVEWRPLSGNRPIGPGFLIRCGGRELGLRAPVELEVRAFDPDHGWCATSGAGPRLSWEVRVHGDEKTAALTHRVCYEPSRLLERLEDWVFGRRRRVRTLRASLERLKARVEREEVLSRLRTSGPD